jgi:hypothetical protein
MNASDEDWLFQLFGENGDAPPEGYDFFMGGLRQPMNAPCTPGFASNAEATTPGGGHGNSPHAAQVPNVPMQTSDPLADAFRAPAPAGPEDPQPTAEELQEVMDKIIYIMGGDTYLDAEAGNVLWDCLVLSKPFLHQRMYDLWLQYMQDNVNLKLRVKWNRKKGELLSFSMGKRIYNSGNSDTQPVGLKKNSRRGKHEPGIGVQLSVLLYYLGILVCSGCETDLPLAILQSQCALTVSGLTTDLAARKSTANP